MIGSNTTEAHPVLALRIKKAVRNGATLVVADPRKIWLTKLAKRHLQLRPGTDVWLLNAQHMKAVPGRKTDVRDAEWIAQLLEHGLLRPSFVPPPRIRRLRLLTRYRPPAWAGGPHLRSVGSARLNPPLAPHLSSCAGAGISGKFASGPQTLTIPLSVVEE